MKESMLEKKFCAMARQAGGRAYKFVSPGNAGVPDRLVILPGGRMGFVELKQRGKIPGKRQGYRIAELKRLGCFVAIVDDEKSAWEAIQGIQAWNPVQEALFGGLVNRNPYGGAR